MSLGTVIKEARESAGLTQDALGRMVGVSGQAVGYWENDITKPRGHRAQRLVAALKIDPVTLLSADVAVALAAGLDSGKNPVSAKAYAAPLYNTIRGSQEMGELIAMEHVPVPGEVFERHPRGFFLPVRGGSMNRVLPDGCYAYVDPASEVENGDVAAVIVGEGEARIARFHRLSNSVVLQPDSADPDFKDEIIDDADGAAVRVLGRVVWFGAPYGSRL